MTEQDEQLIAQLISIVALSSFIITKIVITNYNWAAQIRLCKCCKLISTMCNKIKVRNSIYFLPHQKFFKLQQGVIVEI